MGQKLKPSSLRSANGTVHKVNQRAPHSASSLPSGTSPLPIRSSQLGNAAPLTMASSALNSGRSLSSSIQRQGNSLTAHHPYPAGASGSVRHISQGSPGSPGSPLQGQGHAPPG